jgi:phosphoribosylglycinamide formyltransferase 1
MKRIALFASGAGTNVQNLLRRASSFSAIEISCVIVDNETSPLPERLKFGYPQLQVYRILPDARIEKAERKKDLEKRIISLLDLHGVEWVLLAGYMRIIGPTLLNRFPRRIVNIHPSLLPDYPGLSAYERAFEDQVPESGVTIHLVDEGMDTGPVILQRKFHRSSADTLESFIRRGKDVEWELYPEILKILNESATFLPGE